MKDQLSEEQIVSYQNDGFLMIENFLNTDELAHWSQTTNEAVKQRLAATRKSDASEPGEAENYYAQVFTQCLKLADSHAGMREIMLDPRLGRLAATLAGVDGIRIWHDQALFKPPYGNPTAWHLDNPYWSFSSPNAVSLWVALDDATMANGCLYYVPGTHKMARGENVGIGKNIAGLFQIYPQWKHIETVGCPCPAGSAVFHNGLTAHGAGANMTNRPRRAMTCAYMPDGSVFNGTQNVLPDDYVRMLQVGDVLNDNALNPLVWHAEAATMV